ncbi:TATA box-binding protein-associated factor RNA polymerase I subunit D [Rhinoderma darwinii]|uniref:TATA box-binding protein-associated factor RNA polymerase I subunit D n=1 Tax=Rhinoderma darwinii TaxID=43563 RepID=UPI003F67512C
MDRADIECELNRSPPGSSVEFPHSQELISDPGHRVERENTITIQTSSSSDDEDGLFQATVSAPTRTRRKLRDGETSSSLSALNLTSDDSSDFDIAPRNFTLNQEIQEYLKNPFRKGKRQRKKKRNRFLVRRKWPRRVTKSKPQHFITLAERRRRPIDREIKFPFTPYKCLPFTLYFSNEQYVLGGFLNHIKNLKYERTLKSSLKEMEMDEEMENENFQMRKYSYLDEDGPLSPISEPGENLNEEEAEEEVKVVENSTFILNCQVPSKKNWQEKKTKEKKAKGKKRSAASDKT